MNTKFWGPASLGAFGGTTIMLVVLMVVAALLPPADRGNCPCLPAEAETIVSEPGVPTPAIRVVPSKDEYAIGDLVRLTAEGDSAAWDWSYDESLSVEKSDDNKKLFFATIKPGDYVFVLGGSIANKPILARCTVRVGGQVTPPVVTPPVVTPPVVTPDPTKRPIRVTFVFEKSKHPVPSGVAAAISRLNTEHKILATVFDQDNVTKTGQVPTQYAVALEAAKKAGLPCLVVEYTSGLPKVVADPKTDAQVLEAVR